MIFLNFFLLLLSISFSSVHSFKGCVPLDTVSFDKILAKFKAVLVKFDNVYPYGLKQTAYEKVCMASKSVSDLVVSEVAIKDYGDKENMELAEKYGVNKKDYPVVKLFINGKDSFTFKADSEKDFNEKNLKKFIRIKSGVYIGLDGCYEDFDNLALSFTAASTKEEKEKILKETESLWKKSDNEDKRKSGEVYVKYMRKTLEIGEKFFETEKSRIKNIKKGKVQPDKKQEFNQKINILSSFKIKDEL